MRQRQITKELKHVLNTWYNIDDNEYRINYWHLTYSNIYVCEIYHWDIPIVKIKYKKHDWIVEKNIFERYIKNKNAKNVIRNARKRYS